MHFLRISLNCIIYLFIFFCKLWKSIVETGNVCYNPAMEQSRYKVESLPDLKRREVVHMSTYEVLTLLILFGTFLVALLVCTRHRWYIAIPLHHDSTRLLCAHIVWYYFCTTMHPTYDSTFGKCDIPFTALNIFLVIIPWCVFST